MSVAMDRALMALSLDEDDKPFEMPDQPGFCSNEKNLLSIVGRVLNPECQRMSSLIWRMPRKWQKEGRCRGVALSEERFQFFFDSEHDLVDVLEKGVHTFNEWVIVIACWVEEPPDDYLQFIPLWVQISQIPINYYTEEALMALADMIGEVKVLVFDPSKPQSQPFIRAQVRFNVANPLRPAKVVTAKGGKSWTIKFDYERIQKRCFTCQRLNHEQRICPLEVKKRKEVALARRQAIEKELEHRSVVLSEGDPLFGVLREDQVGINLSTGRPKIAKEVMDEMRQYLSLSTAEDRVIREERVRKSVAEVEQVPMLQKMFLRLEAPPTISRDLNKGKGHVFNYEEERLSRGKGSSVTPNSEKLMASAIGAGMAMRLGPPLDAHSGSEDVRLGVNFLPLSEGSTVFSSGFSEPVASSGTLKKVYKRNRPPKSKRKQRKLVVLDADKGAGKQIMSGLKRKVETEDGELPVLARSKSLKVVPKEGPSNL